MCANLGLPLAKGKYIARMDSDDIAAPNRLEKQVAFLEKNKRVFLLGTNAYVIDKKGKIVGEKNEPQTTTGIYKAYATFHPIIHPSVMMRRIVNDKPFSYQIKYSANNDYYTFFKMLCRGHIFVNLPDKLLYYRIHDKNDTFVKIKRKFLNTLKVRISMAFEEGYRLTAKDIFINIAQSLILLTLPEKYIKELYMLSRGITKPKKITLPFIGRVPVKPQVFGIKA
jgi:glycosyltransferase involved in cell wall biosynthesis